MSARDLLLQHFRWIDGHADVWAVFRDAEALRSIVAGLVEPFRYRQVTAICGIESRGFLVDELRDDRRAALGPVTNAEA